MESHGQYHPFHAESNRVKVTITNHKRIWLHDGVIQTSFDQIASVVLIYILEILSYSII